MIADNHSTRERIEFLQAQQHEIVNTSSRINHNMTENRRRFVANGLAMFGRLKM